MLEHLCLVGNFNIDFFNFRNRFHLMRPKFPKFERDQNVGEKFWFGKNESTEMQNSIKLNEIII